MAPKHNQVTEEKQMAWKTTTKTQQDRAKEQHRGISNNQNLAPNARILNNKFQRWYLTGFQKLLKRAFAISYFSFIGIDTHLLFGTKTEFKT
jgi:hypothetical protein